jgi:hypothetical protein
MINLLFTYLLTDITLTSQGNSTYSIVLIALSNRIQESGVRKQIRILYDWRMNNRV